MRFLFFSFFLNSLIFFGIVEIVWSYHSLQVKPQNKFRRNISYYSVAYSLSSGRALGGVGRLFLYFSSIFNSHSHFSIESLSTIQIMKFTLLTELDSVEIFPKGFLLLFSYKRYTILQIAERCGFFWFRNFPYFHGWGFFFVSTWDTEEMKRDLSWHKGFTRYTTVFSFNTVLTSFWTRSNTEMM